MKNRISKIALVAAAILTSITFASAQTQEKAEKETQKAVRSCFVDKNNNNICDNFEDGSCTIGNGKGLMDGSGNRQGFREENGQGARHQANRVGRQGLRQYSKDSTGVSTRTFNRDGYRPYRGSNQDQVGAQRADRRGNDRYHRSGRGSRGRGGNQYGPGDGTGNRAR